MLKSLEVEFTGTRTIRKKICLLGDFAVGKTSLVRRYVYGSFDETYLTTIGVTLSQKSLIRKDHELCLIVWDLAGGEDFSRPETLYLQGTTGALILCDLTRPDSLPSVEHYFRQLRLASPGAAVVFVGNKSDLVAERQLKTSKAGLANLASTLNTNYILTSAKTGENVKWAFELLAGLIEQGQCVSL